MKNKVIIIAEIGENHLGNLNLAKKMIKDAATAGADIVKFQSYFGRNFKVDDPEKEWFTKVELSNEAHFELKKVVELHGVKFLSSPFSLERAKFLCENLGLKKIKVPSGMMMNFKVLDYLNSANIDTIFISTGMANLEEIKQSINVIYIFARGFNIDLAKEVYLLCNKIPELAEVHKGEEFPTKIDSKTMVGYCAIFYNRKTV